MELCLAHILTDSRNLSVFIRSEFKIYLQTLPNFVLSHSNELD